MAQPNIPYLFMCVFGDHGILSKVYSSICYSGLSAHKFTTIINVYMEYRGSRGLYNIEKYLNRDSSSAPAQFFLFLL